MCRYSLYWVFLFNICITACTVGTDYQSQQFYNDAIIRQELELKKSYYIPKDWYVLFGDQQLNRLIEIGLKNSTDIEISLARLRQARSSLKINRVAFFPQINAQGGYIYEKNSKNIGITADSNYYTAGFDASWELDIWGKGRRQNEADSAKVKAEEYSLANIRVVVTAELASNYINLKLALEKLKIAQQNISLQKEIFETVKAKYKSGLTDEIAYNQAEYLLNTTAAQIPVLQSEIEQYKNALSVLSGLLPSQLPIDIEKKSPIFENNYKYNTKDLYNLPAYVIRSRPDVAAAEQKLIAQNALVGVAVADLYPDVSISGLWGYAATGGASLFNSKSQGYQYKPFIALPLLDWNSLRNKIEEQKHIKEEMLAQYKKTVLTALSELKNAIESVQTELKSNHLKVNALKNINKAVKSSADKYRNGLIDFSDFLTMEQNRLQAQSSCIESQAQIFQNFVAYYKASGGGYFL